MNIIKVQIAYTVLREVEIITSEELSDEEVGKLALTSDTNLNIPLTAPTLQLRRVLKGSEHNIQKIERTTV